ncbi:MAG: PilT/PilU family type 4a pilus ATPase [Elusimicrobia bacterium]|nr:PilT/PilU family type 4a pilus ATPase [Elusimicrobiota bacterium]
MSELADILKAAATQKVSDIFLVPGQPPMVRHAGALAVLQGFGVNDAKEVARLILSNLFEEQRRLLQENLELDCTLTLPNVARFRMNVVTQLNGLHAVLHTIPSAVPRPEDLDLPEAVVNLAGLTRGLVLVTGPAGSGKSTTLVCIVEQINQKRDAHIVAIEDLIEYRFAPKNSLFCQREMGLHAKSYASALKSVMKQNADVVLIGEIRDMETAEAALHIAESGPLVFGSLPTTDTMHTVERIVNMFPVEQHRGVQLRLAAQLKASVSQLLLPRADGKGRVAAREIMIMNPTIENAIREGKTTQLFTAIESGSKQGMINMDKAILRLVRNKLVTPEAALMKCHRPDDLAAAMSALK